MRLLLFAVFALSFCLPLAGQTLLQENFNSGIPAGWTVVDGGSSVDTWFGTTGGFMGQTLDGTEFAFVNSDAAGNNPPVYMHEQLTSPVVNAASASFLLLEFDHHFNHLGLTDSGHVEVFDGSAWNRVVSFATPTGAFSNPVREQLNVTAWANANFQFRFVYDDDTTWAWYWAIDNVHLHIPASFDAGVSDWLSPATNGRVQTASALTATEMLQVEVRNYGSDTLTDIPLYYSINGGPAVGPDTLPGPLPPSQVATHTFTTPANLAAVGNYALRAWTDLAVDLNRNNDTLDYRVRQIANPPRSLPYCEGFEAAPDTVAQTNIVGFSGIDEMDYWTSAIGEGRLRTAAGLTYPRTGSRAITFDKFPTGGVFAINYLTLTYNFAAEDANSDLLELSLALMEHGDESHANDSIWIRGSDTSAWIGLLAWNQLSGGNDGIYFFINNLDISAPLVAAGQNFSESFQLRVGQEDNFASTNLIGSDGLTIDDICLTKIFAINTGVTELITPLPNGQCGDSMAPVAVLVHNYGTDTLFDVPVHVDVSGAGTAMFWDTLPGPLLPFSSDTLWVGTLNTFAGGTYIFNCYTTMPGDPSPLDDTLTTSAIVAGIPAMPATQNTIVCVGDTGVVRVINPDSTLQYSWYDSLSGGNWLGEGDTLLTGQINVPRNFYVEPRVWLPKRVGAEDNAIGNGGSYSFYPDGLLFDVQQDIIIDSVLIYPDDSGSVSVVVRDISFNLVDSIAVTVNPFNSFDPTVIPVDIRVPAGNGYAIHANGSTVSGLWRNSAGGSYPYSLPGVVNITGPLNALSGYYYFFYDWRISYASCPGPRALAVADTTTAQPAAAWTDTANGLTVTFTDTSTNATSWHWDFGDGNQSNQQNPTHTYLVNDTFNVCLTVGNPCGFDTLCDSIVVNCLPPQPGFLAQDSFLTVNFTDTTSGAVAWFWEFGDGATDTVQNPTHTYTSDANYNVCLTVRNVCGDSASTCFGVEACAEMTAAFGINQAAGAGFTFDFTDQSSGAPNNWSWNFGDGPGISLQQNPSYTYGAPGPYTVTLIVTNLCGEKDTISMNLTVVELEGQMGADVRLYPNPNTGRFILETGAALQAPFEIVVADMAGKMMFREKIEHQSGTALQLDVGELPAGMYLLELRAGTTRVARRLLISD